MTMKTIESRIRDAIVDATVTDDNGEEIVDVSACYLALVQDAQGTLPEHIAVSWGPSAARRRQDIREQAPDWVWRAALAGHLVLTDGAVAIADGHEPPGCILPGGAS